MAHAGLIVGLGNPGRQYERTRHNVGFMVVDRLVEDQRAWVQRISPKDKEGALWEWTPPQGDPWLLLKPLTFMNRSGRAVGKVLSNRDIDPTQILVVHDELDLPLGRVRFKQGGGLAGHNGLRSVAESLGTRDFHRLRMGIHRPEPGYEVVSYVLSGFAPSEIPIVDQVVGQALEGILIYCRDGIDTAMFEVHSSTKG